MATKTTKPAGTAGDKPDETTETSHAVDTNQSQRQAVVFLGPYHRYSRGDTACFDAETANTLVEVRKVAVWPKDARRALNPRQGDDENATDIG